MKGFIGEVTSKKSDVTKIEVGVEKGNIKLKCIDHKGTEIYLTFKAIDISYLIRLCHKAIVASWKPMMGDDEDGS